jgi:hypothetical protein
MSDRSYAQPYIHPWTPAQASACTCAYSRTRKRRRRRRAQRPRRIEDRPSASAWRAAGPKAAHTMYMFDTEAVFHAPMFALKAGNELNRFAMLVTAAVFQTAIGPYVVAAVTGLVTHA